MPSENGNVRYVVWSELFGWFFLLARALRLSLQLRKLLIATAAVFLTAAGCTAIGFVFWGDQGATETSTSAAPGDWSWALEEDEDRIGDDRLSDLIVDRFRNPLERAWSMMTAPFRRVFAGEQTLLGVVLSLLMGFWVIFIWGLFGGMIGRIAAVELAAGERYSMGRAFRFARKKWPSFFVAPMMPMSVVFIGALMMAVLGFVMRADIGVLLAAIVWPIVLVGCALLVLALIGLAFGWPLMWSTISTEGTDAFDALGRAWAYTTQRPLHYLFYAAVASLLGGLGLAFVEAFVSGVLHLSLWGVEWGGGAQRISDLAHEVAAGEASRIGTAGAYLLTFWVGLVKLVAVGFVYSYLWTSATAIYLLLRRDVDATELDEVYLEDEPTGQGLAPLFNDDAGVPGVADTPDEGAVEQDGSGGIDDVDEE